MPYVEASLHKDANPEGSTYKYNASILGAANMVLGEIPCIRVPDS